MFTPADREKLLSLLRTHSVRHGDFVLASGQRSDVYVDARLTTLRAEAMPLIGRAILDLAVARGRRPDLVGGLTMGADPVVSAVSLASLDGGVPIDGFLVRKQAKGHGTGRFVEGVADPAGKSALIVEDTCTTGASAVLAIERAREYGFEVVGAACLVDREQGGAAAIQALGVGFETVFTLAELLA